MTIFCTVDRYHDPGIMEDLPDLAAIPIFPDLVADMLESHGRVLQVPPVLSFLLQGKNSGSPGGC